jgi:hypothetical protein
MKFIKYRIMFFSVILFAINLSFSTTYKLIDKEIQEENKEKKFTISVKYHLMEGFSDKSVQDNFNKHTMEVINGLVDTFKNDMKDWESRGEYPSEFEIWDIIYTQNDNLVSDRLSGYQYYAGAAHPTTFFVSINYDLNKNEPVMFTSLFTGDYLKIISNLCIKDLIRQKDEYAPDNPDVSWIEEGAGPKESNYKVFNIMEDTLLITFPVYQVASYAEGPKEVYILYSNIINIIDKKGALGYIIR